MAQGNGSRAGREATAEYAPFYAGSAPLAGLALHRALRSSCVWPPHRRVRRPYLGPDASHGEGFSGRLLSIPLEPVELLLCSLNQVIEICARQLRILMSNHLETPPHGELAFDP